MAKFPSCVVKVVVIIILVCFPSTTLSRKLLLSSPPSEASPPKPHNNIVNDEDNNPKEKTDLKQFDKITKYIRSGVNSVATLETGGEQFGKKGYYIKPTVFSNVKDDMLIAQDEIFGPVQSILKFKDLDEVVRRANNSRYGLAAGVFSQNIDTANTLVRALRVGTVWINCFDTFDATIPFGGYKMSGQGREKGEYGLMNYLQVKTVATILKNPAWL
ncbi:hypothetical protein H5410_025946 [Solanum commersonii]|uniref:Aldehyde dehydrogenase domain-containing protein n=1 Tax=Solanum commersonii TaxID=4109 RepID=A0A9J5Z006_SOLCO|nr:hypothetical protein H5410_025946 [Solanum commersonii]